MSSTDEKPLDSAESALRSALATAHEELPDSETMARIEARLADAVRGGGGEPPAARPGPRAAVAAAVALTFMAGLGAYTVEWTSVSAPSPVRSAQERSDPPPTSLPQELAQEARDAGASHVSTLPSPPTDRQARRRRETQTHDRAASPPSVVPDALAAPAEPPTDEMALVRAARLALPREPARTLELAERHRREFSDGILAEERETLAIEALVALGRRTEAERRAHEFQARWSTSPYRRRLQAALARP